MKKAAIMAIAMLFFSTMIFGQTADELREIPIPAEVVESNELNVSYHLTKEQVLPLYREAIQRWVDIGHDRSEFAGIRVRIVDFNGSNMLGYYEYEPNLMKLDYNAGGGGWYIDPTPHYDEEYFVYNGRQYGRTPNVRGHRDLLSIITHELGHHLGYQHGNGTAVMEAKVYAGQRQLRIRPEKSKLPPEPPSPALRQEQAMKAPLPLPPQEN